MSTSSDAVLQFTDVSFAYPRSRLVLKGLTFMVAAGEVAWVQGANGSGKTTMLGLAARSLSPLRGQVRQQGSCTMVPARLAFHELLTVDEEVEYFRSLCSRQGLARDLSGALERWEFDAALRATVIAQLSSGWRQRLALALAASAGGSLVLLDEPFAALDASGVQLVSGWIRELAKQGTAVVVVHHGSEVPGFRTDRLTTVHLRDGRLHVSR